LHEFSLLFRYVALIAFPRNCIASSRSHDTLEKSGSTPQLLFAPLDIDYLAVFPASALDKGSVRFTTQPKRRRLRVNIGSRGIRGRRWKRIRLSKLASVPAGSGRVNGGEAISHKSGRKGHLLSAPTVYLFNHFHPTSIKFAYYMIEINKFVRKIFSISL